MMPDNFLDPVQIPAGLTAQDMGTLGRYVEIDLSTARTSPTLFDMYGRFDTFTVINAAQLIGRSAWIWFNSQRSNPLPLAALTKIETAADRFYIQNEAYPGLTLKLILGGDLRGFGLDPLATGAVALLGTPTACYVSDSSLSVSVSRSYAFSAVREISVVNSSDNGTVIFNCDADVDQPGAITLPARMGWTGQRSCQSKLYVKGAGSVPSFYATGV
jgi:hypothetical protein